MSTTFCGNPNNHEPHPHALPSGVARWCDGVDRPEVREEIVEKYEPEAADGTKYVKVKIFIEDGDETTIIEIPKTSAFVMEADYRKYIPLEHVKAEEPPVDWDPEIEMLRFSTIPDQYGEGRKFFVRKVKNYG